MGINIIVSSHGLFAHEALRTAEMILGVKQEQIKVVSVTEEKTYDEVLKELTEKIHSYEQKENKTLILVDIFGGTPANIATHHSLTEGDVQIYSGLNIPILLELCLTKPETIEEAKQLIESTYDVSLVDISEKISEGVE